MGPLHHAPERILFRGIPNLHLANLVAAFICDGSQYSVAKHLCQHLLWANGRLGAEAPIADI